MPKQLNKDALLAEAQWRRFSDHLGWTPEQVDAWAEEVLVSHPGHSSVSVKTRTWLRRQKRTRLENGAWSRIGVFYRTASFGLARWEKWADWIWKLSILALLALEFRR